VLAKHQEFMMYFGRESLTATPTVCQQLIQMQLQLGVVLPQASKVVRNSGKPLQ
jgi:hypothetical protein